MEKQIFEKIVNEIRPQLFDLCERFLIKRKLTVEAEDAVQETLFKLWRMHDQLEAYKNGTAKWMKRMEPFSPEKRWYLHRTHAISGRCQDRGIRRSF